jgi:hypothetical protein
MLQVYPISTTDPEKSPGPMNITGGAGTATVGYMNAGTEYSAGVETIFNKTGPNTANLFCSAITPDNPENPTTESIKFTATIEFSSKTDTSGVINGELVNWKYYSYVTGSTYSISEGSGGVAKLIPLQ